VEDPAVEDVVAVAGVVERRHHLLVPLRVDRETEVMHRARPDALAPLVRGAVADEHRQNAAVAGVEKEVCLVRVVEVGLAQDERHPQQIAVELQGVGLVRPPDRDVVGARGVNGRVGRLGGDLGLLVRP